MTALVLAGSLAALGWHGVTVSSPSPVGGVTAALPLTVYQAIKAGANHLAYEPFSRQLYATLGPGMAQGKQPADPDARDRATGDADPCR